MKCKTFKIHLQEETGNLAEVKLNKFLEDLNVTQVFASVVSDEYWSVPVFYDDNFSAPKASAAKFAKSEVASVEPIILTADEEKIYAALREWRNEQAARDGLPPYMIAHNDSLMTMAKIKPKSREELVQIKGFGEKRAEKYGEELLQIINQSQTDFS